MPTGSIWLITTQKVFKTQSVKSMEKHYLGSNQLNFKNKEGFNKLMEQIRPINLFL